MRRKDRVELSKINFKCQFRKNIGTFIILFLIILVFNLTYSFTMFLKSSSSDNIMENENLKIIEVSTIEDEITKETYNEIRQLNHITNIFYQCFAGCSIEMNGTSSELNVIGLNTEQMQKLTDLDIELKDYEIILNNTFKEKYEIGSEIKLSYNSKINQSQGIRETKSYKVVGFYEQPIVNSWYDNVGIISEFCVFDICGKLYGFTADEMKKSNIYKQTVLVFVDDVNHVRDVAEYIENQELITHYALMANEELPMFAKIVMGVGSILIIILIIMSIIVMNTTINSAIKNRYKEIGVLKSIGICEKDIRYILYGELIMLWEIVSICSVFISVIIIKGMSMLSLTEVFAGVNIGIVQILISIIGTLMIMICTTYATIKSASKYNIVEVLRCD